MKESSKDLSRQTFKAISYFQIECDKMAFDYIELKEQFDYDRLMNVLSLYVNNASFIPLKLLKVFSSIEAVNFLIKNNTELKAKMKFEQFMQYSKIFRTCQIFKFKFESLTEMKRKYNTLNDKQKLY